MIDRHGMRGPAAGRLLACTSAAVLGALVVAGCLLALLLEAQGFGRERDTPVRLGYVLLLAAGAIAGVVVPAVVCLRLLDGAQRTVYAVAGVAALAVTVVILGILR